MTRDRHMGQGAWPQCAHIARLEHSEKDLRIRVASRAAQLDAPLDAPRSDPLYQRLFFAHAWLREQLVVANEELLRSNTEQRALPKDSAR